MRVSFFLNQNHQLQNSFRATYYDDKKIVEKDIFSIEGEKAIFSNPFSRNQDIKGIRLSKENDNTVNMYSRYGNLIGIFNQNNEKPQPQINVLAGSFQPMVELKDDDLGITILMARDSNLNGENLKLKLNPLNSKTISFGNNLVIATGYRPEKIKKITSEFQADSRDKKIDSSNQYINKLRNNYTIIGLTGGYGTRLKPISDLDGNNKPSTPYPGENKTLFEISILDSAVSAGKIDSIKYIEDENSKLSGTGGVIVKGLNDGTIDINKPLVLLTGDSCNNVNLAKALYDFENSSNCGIGMVVSRVNDMRDKSCVSFTYNDDYTTYKINDLSGIVNDDNAKEIKDDFGVFVDGKECYYSPTDIMIIAPEILQYLKKYADADGSADYMRFFGLMYNVLNCKYEELADKYPKGLTSANLSIDDLTDILGYPISIKNAKGRELEVKAIIAKDKNGNDAISEDVGTVENYIKTVKKIKNNPNFDSKFTQSLRENIDSNGILYYGENPQQRLAEFMKKYSIKSLSGNVIVHAKPIAKQTNNSATVPLISKAAKSSLTNAKGLYELTKDASRGQAFIKEIMSKPEKLKELSQQMIQEYGISDFLAWYLSLNGYYGQYEKFVDDLFKNSNSIDELLKFCPNWAPWKLEEKAWRLDNPQYSNQTKEYIKQRFDAQTESEREYGFEIGKLPEEFDGDSYDFESLTRHLKNQTPTNITTINGYTVQKLKGGGLNDKFIYLIRKNGHKFILKFDRTNVEDATYLNNRIFSLHEKRTIRKNKYLAADSIFSNVCVNKYLELNGCKNVPKMYYYSQKENAALYEYVEDEFNDKFQNGKLSDDYEGLLDTNDKFKELNDLGIYLNDSALKNVLVDKDGVPKIIDLGHANFIMPFKLGTKHYHIEFSNSNGPDFRSILAGLF